MTLSLRTSPESGRYMRPGAPTSGEGLLGGAEGRPPVGTHTSCV